MHTTYERWCDAGESHCVLSRGGVWGGLGALVRLLQRLLVGFFLNFFTSHFSNLPFHPATESQSNDNSDLHIVSKNRHVVFYARTIYFIVVSFHFVWYFLHIRHQRTGFWSFSFPAASSSARAGSSVRDHIGHKQRRTSRSRTRERSRCGRYPCRGARIVFEMPPRGVPLQTHHLTAPSYVAPPN